ncbi:hypothetical protein AgCh_003593 [Apium graveolens]
MTRRTSLFQKKKGKPATKAVPDDQTLRSTSSTNRALSSKLETATRCRDHVIVGKKLEIPEKRTSNDNRDVRSGGTRVMRIRVVVTQSQLSQIMKESKNSASLSASSAAVQQMLLASALKMRPAENSLSSSTRNKQGGSTSGKWRPRLKSISED